MKINNVEIEVQVVPSLVNAQVQTRSFEIEEKIREAKMRLIIDNLATSQFQAPLRHAKDMALRRVDCKLPYLVDFFTDFREVIYCIRYL